MIWNIVLLTGMVAGWGGLIGVWVLAQRQATMTERRRGEHVYDATSRDVGDPESLEWDMPFVWPADDRLAKVERAGLRHLEALKRLSNEH